MYPHSCELKTADQIREYITGGKAIVALVNDVPYHKQVTYKFTIYNKSTYLAWVWSNEQGWTWLATIQPNSLKLNHFSEDSKEVRGLAYLLRVVNTGKITPPMQVFHFGTCCVCGRRLTSRRAWETGIGRRCKSIRYADVVQR